MGTSLVGLEVGDWEAKNTQLREVRSFLCSEDGKGDSGCHYMGKVTKIHIWGLGKVLSPSN